MTLEQLEALGFDQSTPAKVGSGYLSVKCSRCVALVVNDTPIHERGCPNEMHECAGCNIIIIPARQKYCQDCN
jgi:hypothetical protein